jgi:biopolymer transport protein ExbD
MDKDRKSLVESFASAGTEGMLDVVLGCTLIFLLMSSLVRVGEAEHQERTLPAINLTKSNSKQPGTSRIKRNIITLRKTTGAPQVFFDDKPVSMDKLKLSLINLGGVGHIALRRDKDLSCGLEDKIILMCRDAGIERVAIIIGVARTN